VIIERKKKFVLRIGKPWPISRARFGIEFGSGYRDDAEPGEIIWRHYWRWTSDRIPHLLWRGWRPIGYCAFGRCRVWR
jgi:hypothetical protein